MVHIVNSGNASLYTAELRQAYRLRHRVFVEERRWEALRKPDGLEIDQFDTASAVHILAIEESTVVGYSRLLPTVGPHLLSHVYPRLSQRGIPRATDVFEWTRYCVAPEKRGESAIGNVGSRLLYGVLEYAFSEGLSYLTMQTHPIWVTRFFDFGFEVEPLGLPVTFECEPVVALTIGLSAKAVSRCRRLLRVKSIGPESRGSPLPVLPLPAAA